PCSGAPASLYPPASPPRPAPPPGRLRCWRWQCR
ncbi:hypothetical protein AZZ95_000501, partial [Enterobacter roggenkampii]